MNPPSPPFSHLQAGVRYRVWAPESSGWKSIVFSADGHPLRRVAATEAGDGYFQGDDDTGPRGRPV